MATDYEQFYRDNRHGLGEPTKEFVDFFDAHVGQGSSVLDVGCGQGRDALFIARLGHHVTAIDQSHSGIQDLENDALSEGLVIHTEVADIREYTPKRIFDVIVIDRTLHMLAAAERTAAFRNLLRATKAGSYVLIADERSNMPALKAVLEQSTWTWAFKLERCGFLFVQRN